MLTGQVDTLLIMEKTLERFWDILKKKPIKYNLNGVWGTWQQNAPIYKYYKDIQLLE